MGRWVWKVAQFDEGEAFRQVIIEGAQEQQGIGCEIVGAGAVATVRVRKDDEFGIFC